METLSRFYKALWNTWGSYVFVVTCQQVVWCILGLGWDNDSMIYEKLLLKLPLHELFGRSHLQRPAPLHDSMFLAKIRPWKPFSLQTTFINMYQGSLRASTASIQNSDLYWTTDKCIALGVFQTIYNHIFTASPKHTKTKVEVAGAHTWFNQIEGRRVLLAWGWGACWPSWPGHCNWADAISKWNEMNLKMAQCALHCLGTCHWYKTGGCELLFGKVFPLPTIRVTQALRRDRWSDAGLDTIWLNGVTVLKDRRDTLFALQAL